MKCSFANNNYNIIEWYFTKLHCRAAIIIELLIYLIIHCTGEVHYEYQTVSTLVVNSCRFIKRSLHILWLGNNFP